MQTGHLDRVVHFARSIAIDDPRVLADSQLLDSFLIHHDEVAFEALVKRHGPLVLSVCRRVLENVQDAEDAFQATFLVLLRRAGAIGKRQLLANWLYGVAYRTALKSRASMNRRRAKERRAAELCRPEAAADPIPEELIRWLDHELIRLPEKYRLPILCCDLQGLSRKAAASKLGWPVGTLNWRLAHGRQLLCEALTKRGLAMSCGALALAISLPVARAAVSSTLLQHTVQAGVAAVNGAGLVAGAASAKVVSLTEGVVKSMFLAKLKMGALSVLSIALLASASGLASYAGFSDGSAGSPTPSTAEKRAAANLANAELPLGVSSRNWTVHAPSEQIAQAIADAAEKYRKTLAVEWFGKELPPWPQAWPIHVKLDSPGASGATSFQINDGKIVSVQMSLDGPLDQLLESALPHEITHVLLAHHFAGPIPIPRWADEGAAMLAEAPGKGLLHEKAVQQFLNAGRAFQLKRLFALHDFPADAATFHAESYSVAKFLVETADRQVFLEFVADGMRDGWDVAAKRHYAYENLASMEIAWLKNLRALRQTSESAEKSDNSQVSSRSLAGKQALLVRPMDGQELRFDKGMWAFDGAGKRHKYYTLSFQLARGGVKVQEAPLRFSCFHGTGARLVQIAGTWQVDSDAKLDVSKASAVVEFKLLVPTRDKPRLELVVQDFDVKRALAGDSLLVTRQLNFSQEIAVGQATHRVLAENDNKEPKCWVEFTLDEGGFVSPPAGK